MTTENRFTIDKSNRIFDNGEIMSKTEVVVLLNEQQATINELQSIINHIKCVGNCFDYDYCCETVCFLYNEIKHLKEENRELRQSVEYWQKKYEEGTETFQIN